MDDHSNFIWSYFLPQKTDQVNAIVQLLKDPRAKGFATKFIRCDNAGENLLLEDWCMDEGFGITFKYTSPHGPQYNGQLERKIATLFS